jgi:hypothetical protein
MKTQLLKSILIFSFLIVFTGLIYADETISDTRKYEISAGAGYLELFYGGLRMKASEAVLLGLRAGTVQ